MIDLVALAAEVAASGILTSISTEPAEDGLVLSGACIVAGREIRLSLRLSQRLLAEIPEVRLVDRHLYGYLAHINAAGTICVGRRDGMVPDLTRPAAVVVDVLRRATSEIQSSLQSANVDAIIDEFDAYWRDQRGTIRVHSHVSPSGPPRRLWVQKLKKNNHRPIVVADSVEAYTSYYPVQPWCGDYHEHGIFIPLQPGTRVLPPIPTLRWTERDLRERVMPQVAPRHGAAVEELLKDWCGDEVVVFSLPRTTRGHVLFGAWFGGVQLAHPLHPEGRARWMIPLSFERRDPDYLRPRGGAATDLGERRVLVAGCGSVGAHIAAELARAGVGHITLVDPDTLKPENIYRHDLGLMGVDHPKVVAVSSSLQARYPYLSVAPFERRIEDLVREGTPVISQQDVIILATGHAGVESLVNRLLFEQQTRAHLIHSWVEPYGIGHHALLSQPSRDPGCFSCLFADPVAGSFVENRSAFCAAVGDVDLDLAGCGARFTPFGSLVAIRAAALAVELALDVMTGVITRPLLRSVKGRDDALVAAGHGTTARYALPDSALADSPFASPRCPVCRRE